MYNVYTIDKDTIELMHSMYDGNMVYSKKYKYFFNSVIIL